MVIQNVKNHTEIGLMDYKTNLLQSSPRNFCNNGISAGIRQ